MNILIDRSLVEYIVDYLEKNVNTKDEQMVRCIQALHWTLGTNQPTGNIDGFIEPGQRQIPSDPRRNDVGMGAILNTNSQFL